MKSQIGLYIHVPFCLRKCPYCDFYSVPIDGETADAYTEAVLRAIRHSEPRAVESIYFGGGTPPLLGTKRLAAIIEEAARRFDIARDAEITLEANPAAELDLPAYRGMGFNRISFGVQSAVDSELQSLGRLHTAAEAAQAVNAAAAAGFANISADLMLAIPGQTEESLRESVRFLAELPVSHISAYLLKIEEGTAFFENGTGLPCPDEDETARLYLECVGLLESSGFRQYEISNFAKSGAESRHNLNYWRCGEYLGLGPAAHSHLGGERFFFPRELQAFINAENPLDTAVPDGAGGGLEEYAMLRLRLSEGLNLRTCAEKFGADTSVIAQKARALERNNLLAARGEVIALTPRGFLLSNAVTAELLANLECRM